MARKMKDSGIEWIGEIPEDWETKRVKYIASYNDETLAEDSDKDFEFDYIEIGSVEHGKGIVAKERLLFKNAPSRARRLVTDNDVIVSTVRTYLKAVAAIKDCKFPMVVSTGFVVLRAKKAVLNYLYLKYIALSHQFISEVESKSVGISYPAINATEIIRIKVVVPPLAEQQAIADYLDKKCAQIDMVLAKTRTAIEEYKKLKQAIITNAVTKGVRGNRPMKDSGIAWIGEIPAEWKVKKIRYIGTCQNGISKGRECFGQGFPFVSYSDVYKNYSLPVPTELVESTEEDRKIYSVKKGDVFFTRTSETIEEIGFTSVCLKDIPDATFAGFLIRVRPNNIPMYTRYSKYYFRSDMHREYFVKEMNLVTRASLGQNLLKNLPVLFPPKQEQQAIADYLDKKCATIDTLIAKKEQLITELEAYKKSLIYEYVTGKKEVPE